MPVIRLRQPDINQEMFGVMFHDSVSEHSVDERTLSKLRATGDLFDIVPDSLNQTKQIDGLKRKLEDAQQKIDQLNATVAEKASQYDTLRNDYLMLMEQFNEVREKNAQLESQRYIIQKLEKKAQDIRK